MMQGLERRALIPSGQSLGGRTGRRAADRTDARRLRIRLSAHPPPRSVGLLALGPMRSEVVGEGCVSTTAPVVAQDLLCRDRLPGAGELDPRRRGELEGPQPGLFFGRRSGLR